MSNENCVFKSDPLLRCPPLSERVWRTESRFLFAQVRGPEDMWRRSSANGNIELEFNVGRGCVYSATVSFQPTDYACELVEAVSSAISHVNRRWNLPESANTGSFSGNKDVVGPSCAL